MLSNRRGSRLTFFLCLWTFTSASFAEGKWDWTAEVENLTQSGRYEEAFRIYNEHAQRGDFGAANNLGTCYLRGEGVPKDSVKAFIWYKKAAEEGDALGQFDLANVYAVGVGTPKDLTLARAWALVSRRSGERFQQETHVDDFLRRIERRMTADQLQKSEAATGELTKTYRTESDASRPDVLKIR